jgi:hypothetical protein
MPPKKPPTLSSIFKTPARRSPAGALDLQLPPEVPSVDISEDAIKNIIKAAPASPTPIKSSLDVIQNAIKDKNADFEQRITNKGFRVSKDGYLSSRDGNEDILYYVKCEDKNGIPLYLDMGSYGKDIPANNELFEGVMIKIHNVYTAGDKIPDNIKYLIASARKTDHIVECSNNKFCVVKHRDDASYYIDVFEIPTEEALKNLKNDIELTQTQKPDGTRNIEPSAVISYRIFDYKYFLEANPAIICSENMEFYNRQVETAFSISSTKMVDVENALNDLNILITSFKKNREAAIQKTQNFKKAVLKESYDDKDTSKIDVRIKKLSSANKGLENFIINTNKYNKEFVGMQKIFKEILEANNNLVKAFDDVKGVFNPV